MFLKGTAILDGVTATDGTAVFVRLTNLRLDPAIRVCDSTAVSVENGQFTLTLTPPEVTADWFGRVEYFVDGRAATASATVTSSNYAGGSSKTINLEALSP